MTFFHGRNQLVAALLKKGSFDRSFRDFDTRTWYSVDLTKLANLSMASFFVQSFYDAETEQFLDRCKEVTDSVLLQLWYNCCMLILTMFMKKTCINGWLRRGSMFLFSGEQLSLLLGVASATPKYRAALDLGAGDGNVSLKIAALCNELYVTEASRTMRLRLAEKGFRLIGIDEWLLDVYHFDVISCLNLLDRHPRPLLLLESIRSKALQDNSTVLLSAVLPWEQYVEFSETQSHVPLQKLAVHGSTFEDQVASFVDVVLKPSLFAVEKWTRLPYLCEGDMYRSFYVLDCAVFVLRPLP
ncbi:unnamed protein product [Soboliphyme baturini]|uniref:Methyltransferase-like protein 9 n=1 Tax=Soboliphyme baturini TaxID=241478 RepID=A0A183IC20_9BILA|nr:unnamed protein product [Soboliphyme baturini]